MLERRLLLVIQNKLALQIRSDFCELGEGGLEVFYDFGGDDVGIGRWPRAHSACQVYDGTHRDFEVSREAGYVRKGIEGLSRFLSSL